MIVSHRQSNRGRAYLIGTGRHLRERYRVAIGIERTVVDGNVCHTSGDGDVLTARHRRLVLALPGVAGSKERLNLRWGQGAIEDFDFVNQPLKVEVAAVGCRPSRSVTRTDLIVVVGGVSRLG
jgi:hypothetical protein